MKKMKKTLVITFVNGHIHTMKGWDYDITFERECIIHHNIPNISGVGVHDFVVNRTNILYYEEYSEFVEVDE